MQLCQILPGGVRGGSRCSPKITKTKYPIFQKRSSKNKWGVFFWIRFFSPGRVQLRTENIHTFFYPKQKGKNPLVVE